MQYLFGSSRYLFGFIGLRNREKQIQIEYSVVRGDRKIAAVLFHEIRYALYTEAVIILIGLCGNGQTALIKLEEIERATCRESV